MTNTVVEAVIHSKRNHLSCKTSYLCVFKLNGQQMTAEFEAEMFDDKEKIVTGIRDAIARQVANSIAASVMKSVHDAF